MEFIILEARLAYTKQCAMGNHVFVSVWFYA